MTYTEIIQRWIESAAAGRVKFDKRELTAEENALLIQVLQYIAGDLLMADQKVREQVLEEAAQVIDQCNREGPYNAIQGASRIRALASRAEEKP